MSILCNETQDKSTEANADFVTIITVDGRANKLVTRSKDGKVSKDAGPPISSAIARTFHVKNCKAMARLQRKIGKKSNQVLSLGFVPGTEPKGCELAGEPYNIVSQKIMGEAIGADSNTPEGRDAILGWHEIGGKQCICRLKANMAPSTWCLFDIDAVRGMPDHLTNMDSNKRRTALAEVISGFAEAGIVVVPSTTGRVLIDGKPMDATGEHFYIQLRDAADLERFGAVLLQRSLLSNYGFMRPRYSRSEPDKVVARIPWGIADPTTFSHERLVYDGAPEVRGEGLKVSTAVIEEIKGGRLRLIAMSHH